VTSRLLPTYARADLAFERGEGAWLTATTGDRYLDFGSGVAVNALGHAHPALVAALTDQAQKVWHVSNIYRIPEGERLAARFCEATFADTVFFCNSGAEAMEAAIKMARKYHAEKFYFCTKNNTMVVLLKTTSVRVSSMQIIPKPYKIVVNMT
jgi:acetylornithine/N-succinyldiaminopimelate aminotransferase